MADQQSPKTDDPKRRGVAVGGSPAVADDGDVAFGAMAGIGVLAAIIVSMMALTGMFGPSVTTTVQPSAVVATATEGADAIINATDDEIELTGTVPSQAIADELHAAAVVNYDADHIIDHLEVVEGASPFTLTINGDLSNGTLLDSLGHSFDDLGLGESFTNNLAGAEAEPVVDEPVAEEVEEEVEEAAAEAAAASIVASDDAITLSGTVPSDSIADELRALAAANYTADQITDELEVVDGADPFTLDASGTLDDAALRNALGEGLGGLGLASGLTDGLTVSEGGSIVAALNDLVGLDPILFQTGNAVIIPESQATLDEAATILKEFPDAAVEVGGHTDSRGGAEGNKVLSQSRADAVVAALVERGVTNELSAVGYGEEQLKEDPDATLEQQQINRRIEFRVL